MKLHRPVPVFLTLLAACLLAMPLSLRAQPAVVISEIMYNPVAEPSFDPDGSPVFDLSSDIHEFIELHNPGDTAIDLTGWRLSSGITYSLPPGTIIQPGAYLVIAKNPIQLAALPAYALVEADLLGPYDGLLSNNGETIRLRDNTGLTVDEVTYSDASPWPIGADALGAGDRWTGLNSVDYQYRGRSLERVSSSWNSKDPANWMASPLPGEPSPGRPGAVVRETPQPVVIRFSAKQNSDNQLLIRSNRAARIHCTFSATNDLSNVQVEYFVDDINSEEENTKLVTMEELEPGAYTAVLPGQTDRAVVRYRFRANRGSGDEPVSPRLGDPYRWHGYFVTPQRLATTNDIYDMFMSVSNINRLGVNLNDNPNRGYLPAAGVEANGRWNDEVPVIFVHNGNVREAVARYNGSFFRRSAGRQSYKSVMPRYNPLRGRRNLLLTDKDNITVVGYTLFREVGLPTSFTSWVDLYVNNNPVRRRLYIQDMDQDLIDAYHQAQAEKNPDQPLEASGQFYKSSGILADQGPYWRGDGNQLVDKSIWPSLERYSWVYSLKNNKWRGFAPFKKLIDDMWQARGANPADNIPAMRAHGEANWNIDEQMTYMAVRNWMGTWDDTVHNFLVWQRSNGKWSMLPWDFDADMGGSGNSAPGVSIWRGEIGAANVHGVHPFKDTMYKAFREEYKQRLFFLNNTFLHPDNIAAMGFPQYRPWAISRLASVNSQLGLGPFKRPDRPSNLQPVPGQLVFAPANLEASPYGYSAIPASEHVSTTWQIRSANDTYLNSVYEITTASPVTSIPLPFDQLTFGEVYYWRCVYHAANGRPSLPSDETAFAYGHSDQPLTIIPIDNATIWKYEPTGDAQPADWNQPDFDDSGWNSGPALLGSETARLAQPIRTEIGPGRTTYYFRKRFNFIHEVGAAVLEITPFIDDGVILYLNGQEVWRTRMPNGPASLNTRATEIVNNAVAEGPFILPDSSLLPGENVLAAEVHQADPDGSDFVFGLSMTVTIPSTSRSIVLNELAADNRSGIENNGRNPDWVELYNKSDEPVDLAGMALSDDPLLPAKFVFPADTIIPPNGYVVVWCDQDFAADGLHTGFALSADGETLSLYAASPGGPIVRDTITFGLQAADFSIGRTPDGFGDWQLNFPTPGAPNQLQLLSDPDQLTVNEWMANPNSGDDWLELHNAAPLPVALGGVHLTCDLGDPTNTRLPELSFIAGGGFVQLVSEDAGSGNPSRLNFKLSSSGESIWVFAPDATYLLDSVIFGVQTRGISQGRLPDGGPTFAFFPDSPSPKASNRQFQPLTSIQINEVLAHAGTFPVPAPQLEGAIELQNTTPVPINVGNWWLSDDPDEPKKFQIPDPTIIQPGEFHVVYENQFNASPGSSSSFSLDAVHGGEVVLSVADAGGNLTSARTSLTYGPSAPDVSFGRVETSVGIDVTALAQITLGVANPASVEEFRSGTGAANAPARLGPVVISEIHYHPTAGDAAFIELQNISPTAVNLFDPDIPTNSWRLDGVGYDFPAGMTLEPGQFLLLAGSDPDDFRTRHGVGADVLVVGPFPGVLRPTGERLELQRPGIPDDEGLNYVTVDAVDFNDKLPWPLPASGAGASLQLLPVNTYGNDPANWTAARPTPGDSLGDGAAPQVTRHPAAFDVAEGVDVTLTAAATGSGSLSFQWRFNGLDLPGANTSSLLLTNVSADDMGIYNLIVFDESGFAISEPAPGIVRPAPKILTHPNPQNLPPGDTAFLAVTARGTGGIGYQWYLYDAPLFGATNSTLVITNIQLPLAGEYRVAVTDAVGTVFSDVANVVVLVRPKFTENPQTQTVFVGDDVIFRAEISPSHPALPAAYRWRRNGRTVVRENGESWDSGVLVLTNVQLSESGARYSVVATNAGNRSPGILSRTATLTVIEIIDLDGDRLPDDWEVANGLSPDDPNDADTDGDGDGMTGRQEFIAGTDADDPDSYLSIETTTADVDGVVLEFNAVSNITYSVEWREGLSAGGWSKLRDVVQTETAVQLVTVTDARPLAANRIYRLTTPRQPNATPGPTILRSPQPQIVGVGETARFDVLVEVTGSVGFQWIVDDLFISGATSSSLIIPDVQLSDAGSYSVQITDELGQANSAFPAPLVVRPQVLVQPQDQSANAGQSVMFTVSADGNNPLGYQWTFNGETIPGATDPTLVVADVQPADAGIYQAIISHETPLGTAATLSREALLTVSP